jgi:peroxiredoxin
MKQRSHPQFLAMTLVALALTGGLFLPARSQVRTVPTSPNMKLQGLDGVVYDMNDLRGSVVLVSFGATWCGPCTTELRALNELLVEYRSKPVKFYWVSIESPTDVTNGVLKQYAKDRKVSFPILRDTAQMVFLQFSPKVRLPMIVLLRKDGHIDAPVQFGMESPAAAYKANLRVRLNKLLAAPSDSDR